MNFTGKKLNTKLGSLGVTTNGICLGFNSVLNFFYQFTLLKDIKVVSVIAHLMLSK